MLSPRNPGRPQSWRISASFFFFEVLQDLRSGNAKQKPLLKDSMGLNVLAALKQRFINPSPAT